MTLYDDGISYDAVIPYNGAVTPAPTLGGGYFISPRVVQFDDLDDDEAILLLVEMLLYAN